MVRYLVAFLLSPNHCSPTILGSRFSLPPSSCHFWPPPASGGVSGGTEGEPGVHGAVVGEGCGHAAQQWWGWRGLCGTAVGHPHGCGCSGEGYTYVVWWWGPCGHAVRGHLWDVKPSAGPGSLQCSLWGMWPPLVQTPRSFYVGESWSSS